MEEERLDFDIESEKLSQMHNAKLNFSWGKNQMAFFITPLHFSKEVSSLENRQDLHSIDILSWSKFDDRIKKFIVSTHLVFSLPQSIESKKDISRKHLLKISELYCKNILKQIEELKETKNIDKDTEELIQLMRDILAIWSLFEAIHLKTTEGSYITDNFISWLNANFEVLTEEDELDNFNWLSLKKLISRGNFEEACDLLVNFEGNPVIPLKLKDILLSMPKFEMFRSKTEFNQKWGIWKQDCREFLIRDLDSHRGDYSHYEIKNFEEIGRLIYGEELVEEHTWFEDLGRRLLFVNPSVESKDLIKYVKKENCTGDNVDLAFYSIIESNISQLAKCCSQLDLWLTCHLFDLMSKMANFDLVIFKETESGDLRESFILQYGCSLMNEIDLWRMGADYLLSCPHNGRGCIQEYLERLPLESDLDAQKVLSFCQTNNFHDQYVTICQVMGNTRLRQNILGSAIYYFAKIDDHDRIYQIVDVILREYLESGVLNFSSLVFETLGRETTELNCLDFLRTYTEFHEFYRQKDYKNATAAFMDILIYHPPPSYFLPTLLIDCVPLLENSEVLFDSASTFEIMRCLEEVRCQSQDKEDESKEISDQLQLVRLALARNLSRSFL